MNEGQNLLSIPPEASFEANRWALCIAAIAIILPSIALVETLIIIPFGLEEYLGQSYGPNDLNSDNLVIQFLISSFFNAPFVMLAFFARYKIVQKWPDVNATKSAIIGSVAALLIVILPFFVLDPSLFYSSEQGAGQAVGFLFIGFSFVSALVGFIGWFIGRLIWRLRTKPSRKS